MKAKLPAELIKVESKADRSYKLMFATRELAGEEASFLLSQIMKEGWLLFSPNDDLEEADIPDEKPDAMTGKKTQAQRLRNVLAVLWEQQGKPGNREDFYQRNMEKIIDMVKEKLE